MPCLTGVTMRPSEVQPPLPVATGVESGTDGADEPESRECRDRPDEVDGPDEPEPPVELDGPEGVDEPDRPGPDESGAGAASEPAGAAPASTWWRSWTRSPRSAPPTACATEADRVSPPCDTAKEAPTDPPDEPTDSTDKAPADAPADFTDEAPADAPADLTDEAPADSPADLTDEAPADAPD